MYPFFDKTRFECRASFPNSGKLPGSQLARPQTGLKNEARKLRVSAPRHDDGGGFGRLDDFSLAGFSDFRSKYR